MAARRALGRPTARRNLENALRRAGHLCVAGVDEVGRGCLAGPVTAAAVILDPDRPIAGLRDSKLLSPEARERLHDQILARAIAWRVVSRSPADIDRLNIHKASLAAMREAVLGLAPAADYVLADGFAIPGLDVPHQGLVKGDQRCACIAAASIVAKVTRDRLMVALDREDPRYGYVRHKGYATAEHLAAIRVHGLSDAHRRSFRPATLFDLLMDDEFDETDG
ncbi:ribonuclease HII [Luteitalea sp. TBR-22]|uniref:ribonuclease HII n=1 Tax=Luteitalea sp. TBR-22 TaxID=2802971 RepID=UPI001AFA53F5|nr:ribonuclease HII [Luteitalea sp. TBR-22]BCS33889.1 ribonuclease HII [Luteitalea sp. TBR-22]